MTSARQGWLERAGYCLGYVIEGPEAAPALVFLNSLATDLSLWDDQCAALSGRWRILRFDQRGHGSSTAPTTGATLDDLADDAAAVMEVCGIETAVLVGVSIGGVTAMRLGARLGGRLRGAMLCDCQWATGPGVSAAWADRLARAGRLGMAGMVEETVERWFTPELRSPGSAAADRVRAMIRATSLEGFAGCAAALQDYHCRAELKGLSGPVELVCGAADTAIARGMAAMQEELPGVPLSLIPGAGHLPNIEQPAAFNQILAAFLARLPAARTD